MIKKSYTPKKNFCRVTFKLDAGINAETAAVCGDFNEWSKETHPKKRLKDGGFSTTIMLDAEKTYRFRYCLDGDRWENDAEADGYAQNDFGTEDSLLQI